MLSALKRFERFILGTLIVMLAVVVLLATLELGWLIVKDIISPPMFLFETEEILDIFGMFLLVLIGLELLETIKIYMTVDEIHVEVVFMVAMTAIARKVITLDLKAIPSLALLGMAAIIVALAAGYYLVKRTWREERRTIAP